MPAAKFLFIEGVPNFTRSYTPEERKLIKKAHKKTGWASALNPIFEFMGWINRYRLYRPYRYLPYEPLYGWGHLLGGQILGRLASMRSKVRSSMRAFFPNASPQTIEKLTTASLKFQGGLLLDFMFHLPRATEDDFKVEEFYEYTNLEILDNALKEGKGVILPFLHIGAFLHIFGALCRHPNKYKVAVVAQMSNSAFYQFLINKAPFDKLWVYPSISFKRIGPLLEKNLRDNAIVIIYVDYTMPNHMRVPMWPEKYPYLINTSQSCVALHEKTGAPIIPCISHPNHGNIGHYRYEFLDNSNIMSVVDQYHNAPQKEYFGRVSMEINKTMYPYAKKYAHVWEEINMFSLMRLTDKVQFSKNISISDFLLQIEKKMETILEKSFEPDRNDELILTICQEKVNQIQQKLKNPATGLREHKTKITLPLMNGSQEFQKLLQILYQELKQKNETEVLPMVDEWRVLLKEIYFKK